MSPTISSANGVKQGCVLSPTLFNIFLSDFPSIFDNTCDPVSLGDAHLNCMMFADDLVLLSTTAEGLQCWFDKLLTYTRRWNLNVNIDKTKVIIFNKGGHIIKRFNFWLGTEPVSITQQYCYLGIIFRHLVLSIVQSLTSPIKPWFQISLWFSPLWKIEYQIM